MSGAASDACVPWFVQCDGFYIAAEGSQMAYGWLRLEGHGAISARVSGDVDETTFGEWDAIDGDHVRLAIGERRYVMTAVDDVHNTVHIAPEETPDERDTFAFIDEEGAFKDAYS